MMEGSHHVVGETGITCWMAEVIQLFGGRTYSLIEG